MILSEKWYNFLKKLGTIILPAVAAFYSTLADIWGIPFADKIPETIMAIVVLLNAWLGVKSAEFYASLVAESVPEEHLDDGMDLEG